MSSVNYRAFVCVALNLIVAPAAEAQQSSGSPLAEPAPKPHEFVSSLRPHQWRASKLIGVDVYGAENEKLGDISDVLVGAEGEDVVVVGVGGFLGLGDRQIAVPFRAIEWRFGDRPTNRDTQAERRPDNQGVSGTPRKTVDHSRRGYPDYAVLRLSRETLKDAQEFRPSE